ncbi:uncharacterized protein B0I36DRAFT_89086 [Microdochium trichocladiopsis]|uniref:Diphthine--ammonia ligase n=1 Tax=Microdochium trichocladiopsis TaxID=1682393 RepID=A0A9P9BWK8_9PEZI|nr:uncharacterized protein B0I36DRAFT_89086 [Microdochium trichocladiopsis]KAH7035176.1 hypothetical protein B0I36DRAFT_89086 [Microdochium trichocladiopsis]
MATGAAQGPSLDVVALVSGGKDSFYSILHCLAQGHQVVALANLHPPSSSSTRVPPVAGIAPAAQHRASGGSDSLSTAALATHNANNGSSSHDDPPESDLNSFMYQTVGHQTIPLYAQATGLPLFRQPIQGTAIHHGISYSPDGHHRRTDHDAAGVNGPADAGADADDDETESLVPLLRAVLRAHPNVNAVSTGAILSTYQRTRVESVAIRLGLVPLGYLWQYPDLPRSLPPPPSSSSSLAVGVGSAVVDDDAQLLRDMAHTGLEARIIKVASAGLDEGTLWENVASETGISRIQRGLRKFGGGGKGAVLGEGGEFETLVVDGPPELFKGRIVVHEDDRQVVREGGGSEWLLIRRAAVEMKTDSSAANVLPAAQRSVPIPALLDSKFEAVLEVSGQQVVPESTAHDDRDTLSMRLPLAISTPCQGGNARACFIGEPDAGSVQQQTERVVRDIRSYLAERSLEPVDILNSIIVLRHMNDFPAINKLYGSLFTEANPPARVTISCGDQLPSGCQIVVYLVMQRSTRDEHRKGLHVQSRSYWAPANIGPYSQAIAYPLLPPSSSTTDGNYHSLPAAVSIAGQIPLVPATMEFPTPRSSNSSSSGSQGPDVQQITLALQHLWRVGAAMDVAWWTSAAAYFPSTTTTSTAENNLSSSRPSPPPPGGGAAMVKNSIAAAAAWREAHVWSAPRNNASGNDDDEGPDLWDRRYNAQYQSFASSGAAGGGGDGDSSSGPPQLPKWNVVDAFAAAADDDEDDDDEDADYGDEEARERRRAAQRARKMAYVPFFFAAEVEELPRSAGVEWHAHIGLSKIPEGSVRVCSSTTTIATTAAAAAITSAEPAPGNEEGRGKSGERDLQDEEEEEEEEGEFVIELHHVAVTTGGHGGSSSPGLGPGPGPGQSTYLHTTAVLRRGAGAGDSGTYTGNTATFALADAVQHLQRALAWSIPTLLGGSGESKSEAVVAVAKGDGDGDGNGVAATAAAAAAAAPYLVYTDAAGIAAPIPVPVVVPVSKVYGSHGSASSSAPASDPAAAAASASAAVIPCHSLHDGQGRRLAAVALFETILTS